VRETTLQTPRSVKQEGEEVLQVPDQKCSPPARDEDHGEAGCAPAAHGGPQWSRSPLTAPAGPHAGAGGCPQEAVTLWGHHAGAGSWQGLRTLGERSPRRSRFAGRACDPVGDPRWSSLFLKDCTPWEGLTGAVCEELQPVGRTHIGEVQAELSPVGGTLCWSRGRV